MFSKLASAKALDLSGGYEGSATGKTSKVVGLLETQEGHLRSDTESVLIEAYK